MGRHKKGERIPMRWIFSEWGRSDGGGGGGGAVAGLCYVSMGWLVELERRRKKGEVKWFLVRLERGKDREKKNWTGRLHACFFFQVSEMQGIKK